MKISKDRIKYYGENDLATRYYLGEVIDFIENFDVKQDSFTLEDIIELCNVLKYLNLEYFKEYLGERRTKLKKHLNRTIGYYLSNTELNFLGNEYEKIYAAYVGDFWEMFVNFKLIKKTKVTDFQKFLEENKIHIPLLLKHKMICEKYESIIKILLLENPRHFEIFINKFDSLSVSNNYFPFDFTTHEINNWARSYCKLGDANSNYLLQLSMWSSQNEKKIDDIILLKARRRYDEINNEIFDLQKGQLWSIGVGFKEGLDKDWYFEQQENSTKNVIYFNKKWLDEEQEFPTILNNFIYFFGFFNDLGQFSLISSPYSSGSFVDKLRSKSKYGYNLTTGFDSTRSIFRLIFLAYYDYLSHNNIDLEEIFVYYFEELVKIELNNKNFFFSASSSQSSYYERSKALIPEMDSILKQYDLYRRYGEVDKELFELQSKNTSYVDIKSIQARKYIYYGSDEILQFCFTLFDNQSRLAFPENKNGLSSFYDYVQSGIVLDDYYNNQKQIIIDTLVKNNVIAYKGTNEIHFKDIRLVKLYKLLWEKGYISILTLSDELLRIIENEVHKGNLRYGNTLFSEQESDYISYIMDNKKYNNGLAIRNKITHGSYAKKSLQDYKKYYLELMMIQLLYTVKINEELEYEDIKEHDEKGE